MDPPLSLKLMVPVGELPDTDAVKVTAAPTLAGLAELVTAVVVVTPPPPPVIVSTTLLLDVALAELPLYVAMTV